MRSSRKSVCMAVELGQLYQTETLTTVAWSTAQPGGRRGTLPGSKGAYGPLLRFQVNGSSPRARQTQEGEHEERPSAAMEANTKRVTVRMAG